VLALLGWAEADALTPADLRLVVDPGAAEPLGLQHQGRAVAPAGLHRVRSTTAPPGLYRLLLGWSFARQHRPWALTWGPLADLPFLPRLALAGFVITPASWRVPDAAVCGRASARARWRRQHHVPAQLQAGDGDELLLIDLDARGAGAQLARFAGQRAHEVWPPLGRPVDAGGRRLEVVVPVVDRATGADREARAAAIRATAAAGQVPPPSQLPASSWTSFRLYGAEQGQDAVLHEVVAPVIAEALAAGDIDRWFFLRYLAPGDPRPHLRLRVHASGPVRFQRRLEAALAPLRARGDLAAVEMCPYFPETARFGGPEGLALAEAVFQADSALVLALLAAESEGALDPDGDLVAGVASVARVEASVLVHDVLARALGLGMAQRLELAEQRRSAAAGGSPEPDGWPALAGKLPPSLASALRAFQTAVRAAAGDRAGSARGRALLPALLHLQSVRLLGPHPASEQLGYVFWARALEGLVRRGLVDPQQPAPAAEA
jgi:lantibiotic biosynthesis protein